MKAAKYIWGCISAASLAIAADISGTIINVPDQIEELYKEKDFNVINGDNYQGRISVELIPLIDDSTTFTTIKGLVDENYQFQYKDIDIGEYQLVVNSYDFEFLNDRYKIEINQDGKVHAIEDSLYGSNSSSVFEVTSETPLTIEFHKHRQFYEKSGTSIKDLLLDSPLGYVFKSTLLTVLFTMSMGIILASWAIPYFFPDFAEELKEMKENPRAEKEPKMEIVGPSQKKVGAKAEVPRRRR